MLRRVVSFAAIFWAAFAGAEPPDPAAIRAAEVRGAEILAPFKRELKAALAAGLAEGPAEAVRACNTQAPAIAASTSAGDVRVGRSSHRLRNPDNAPATWMEPVIARYMERRDRAPRVVDLGGGRVGYAEPIVLQAQCLVCHGSAIPEPVAAALSELYPRDRARNFREGDFRGIFWAEFDAPAAAR